MSPRSSWHSDIDYSTRFAERADHATQPMLTGAEDAAATTCAGRRENSGPSSRLSQTCRGAVRPRIKFGTSEGTSATFTPADVKLSIFAAAVPSEPVIIAPA